MDMNKPWAQWMIDEYYGKNILDVLADEMERTQPKQTTPISTADIRKSFRFSAICKNCGNDMETTSLRRKYCGMCRISIRRQARNAKLSPVDNSVDTSGSIDKIKG